MVSAVPACHFTQERRLEKLAKKAAAAVKAAGESGDTSTKEAAASMVQSAAVASTASAAGASAASGFVLPTLETAGSPAANRADSMDSSPDSNAFQDSAAKVGTPGPATSAPGPGASAPASAPAAAAPDDLFDRESEDDEFEGVGSITYAASDNNAAGPRGWAFRRGHERWDPSATEHSRLALPGDGAVDVEALMALPPAMQEEYLAEIDKARRSKVREAILPVANNPLAFSSTQLSSFLKGAKVNVDIRNAQKAAAQASTDGNRIAGEANREYLLVKGGQRTNKTREWPKAAPVRPSPQIRTEAGPTLPHLRQAAAQGNSAPTSASSSKPASSSAAAQVSTHTGASATISSLVDDGSDWDSDSSLASDDSVVELQELKSQPVSKHTRGVNFDDSAAIPPPSSDDNSDRDELPSRQASATATTSAPASSKTLTAVQSYHGNAAGLSKHDIEAIKARLDAELGPELLQGVEVVVQPVAAQPKADTPHASAAPTVDHSHTSDTSDEGWSSGSDSDVQQAVSLGLPAVATAGAATPSSALAAGADDQGCSSGADSDMPQHIALQSLHLASLSDDGSGLHQSVPTAPAQQASTSAAQAPAPACTSAPSSPAGQAEQESGHSSNKSDEHNAAGQHAPQPAALTAALATATGMASWAQRAVQRAIKQHSSSATATSSAHMQSSMPSSTALGALAEGCKDGPAASGVAGKVAEQLPPIASKPTQHSQQATIAAEAEHPSCAPTDEMPPLLPGAHTAHSQTASQQPSIAGSPSAAGDTAVVQPQTGVSKATSDAADAVDAADAADDALMEQLQAEEAELREARNKGARGAEGVGDDMQGDVIRMLNLFGIPYIVAPMEAEAQCAELERLGLVQGTITDDSDAFLFGSKHVYRNIFQDTKYVEEYAMAAIEAELGLSRDDLVRAALLLGSDYTAGIKGVGEVNTLEILSAFPGDEGIQEFATWLQVGY